MSAHTGNVGKLRAALSDGQPRTGSQLAAIVHMTRPACRGLLEWMKSRSEVAVVGRLPRICGPGERGGRGENQWQLTRAGRTAAKSPRSMDVLHGRAPRPKGAPAPKRGPVPTAPAKRTSVSPWSVSTEAQTVEEFLARGGQIEQIATPTPVPLTVLPAFRGTR